MAHKNKKAKQKSLAADIVSSIEIKVGEAGEATKKMKKSIERSAEKLAKKLVKLMDKKPKEGKKSVKTVSKTEKKAQKEAAKAAKNAAKAEKNARRALALRASDTPEPAATEQSGKPATLPTPPRSKITAPTAPATARRPRTTAMADQGAGSTDTSPTNT